ncbi:hypothetical protein EDC01DRAFT_622468 [Geopyxis carbonaria]|nr:hypothetical protein EDC01DRAFT_622468 [Geopyxis carbonaria]
MADESELSRFREQWKEEVTARAHGQPQGSVSSSSATQPHQQKAKGPSFSHTRAVTFRTEDDSDDDNLAAVPEDKERFHSPPAVRRPSVTGVSRAPRSALEHYEQAVQKEGEGNLGESLKLYRKAFRMDAGVDKSYKEKHFPRPPNIAVAQSSSHSKDSSKKIDTTPQTTAAIPTRVEDLIASFSALRIEAIAKPSLTQNEEETEEEKERQFSLLAAVPSEILLRILHYVAIVDIATFVRLSQVCKSLCYVVSTEEQIWKTACESTFSLMLWDWKVSVSGLPIIHQRLGSEILEPSTLDDPELGEDEDQEQRRIPIDECEVVQYKSSWREMFHLRPRVRYNGIYISTCNYHRPGGHAGHSLSWGTPVHIVTYYRYLRFYPDGTLLSLLTTHEPSEVVYAFSKPSLTPAHLGGLSVGTSTLSSWGKHVSQGRWRMDPVGCIDIETEAPAMPRYLFRMQLRIKNVRSGGIVKGCAKLNWEHYWSWNKLTDDLAVFEGRNDKPFFFSRVGAVEKEMGYV